MAELIENNTPLPKTYEELVEAFIPRPIHDKVGHENTLGVIDALAGKDLNEEQEDYLELLSRLVEAYEEDLIGDELASLPRGLEMLKYLCEVNSVTGVELGRILGVGRAHISLLLNGNRKLTVAHLQRLSHRFKVSPVLFLERTA